MNKFKVILGSLGARVVRADRIAAHEGRLRPYRGDSEVSAYSTAAVDNVIRGPWRPKPLDLSTRKHRHD